MRRVRLRYALFTGLLLMTVLPGHISVIAKAVLVLSLFYTASTSSIRTARHSVMILFFWILISFHSIFSEDIVVTLFRLVLSCGIILSLFIFSNTVKLIDFLAGASLASGLWVVVNFIGLFHPGYYDNFGLYKGLTYNANALGGTIALISAPLALRSILDSERALLGSILFIMSVVVLWLYGSRASLLSFLIVAGVFLVKLFFIQRRNFFLMLTALTLFVVVSFEKVVSSFFRFFIKYEHLSNPLATRNQSWGLRFEAIERKPLKGWGYGVNPIRISPELATMFDVNKNMGSTEKGNSYLAILEEFGLVLGPLLIAILLLNLYYVYRHNRRINPLLIAVLFASLIHAFFESWLIYLGSFSAIWFWTLLLISYNSHRESQHNNA